MGAMVSRDGGVLGAAVLLALGGVLAVGAAWLARRRCLPSELEAATAGEVKLQGQAGEPAAANAQLELAVAGGGGGVDCCPAAAACTSTSTGGAASTAGGAAPASSAGPGVNAANAAGGCGACSSNDKKM